MRVLGQRLQSGSLRIFIPFHPRPRRHLRNQSTASKRGHGLKAMFSLQASVANESCFYLFKINLSFFLLDEDALNTIFTWRIFLQISSLFLLPALVLHSSASSYHKVSPFYIRRLPSNMTEKLRELQAIGKGQNSKYLHHSVLW